MCIGIYFRTSRICIVSSMRHLDFHTPSRTGPYRWWIKDEDTGMMIDSYTPSRISPH